MLFEQTAWRGLKARLERLGLLPYFAMQIAAACYPHGATKAMKGTGFIFATPIVSPQQAAFAVSRFEAAGPQVRPMPMISSGKHNMKQLCKSWGCPQQRHWQKYRTSTGVFANSFTLIAISMNPRRSRQNVMARWPASTKPTKWRLLGWS